MTCMTNHNHIERQCERRLSAILKDEQPNVWIPLLPALWSETHCSALPFCFLSSSKRKTLFYCFLCFSSTHASGVSLWPWIYTRGMTETELFLSDIGVFHFFPPLSATVPFPHKCYRKLYIFPGGLAGLTLPNAYQRQKNDPSVCRENLLTLHETNLILP